jgi:predicted Zn-dependent protease
LSEETPQQKPENPLETLDKALDSYEESIGLKKFTETDVTVYMNLNSEDLRKMSPEECVEGAYLLNQEALYVQHEITNTDGLGYCSNQ